MSNGDKRSGVQVPLRALELAIKQAGSARRWARAAGVSPQHVCDVRLRRRDPGPACLAALGYRRVVSISYVPLETR